MNRLLVFTLQVSGMEQHYTAKSKGTWGREAAKTGEELNRLCNEFFNALIVPPEWKWLGWDNAIDPNLGLISVGKAFRDMRTSGIDLMHYRIYFCTFSQRGGVCERSIIDYGKFAYKAVDHGIFKIDELNAFIAKRYNKLPDPSTSSGTSDIKEILNDNSDGLQHFRDRFTDCVAD